MEIWRGRVLWRVYVHPHTQLKKSGIPHTHTQSMREFPVKTGTGSGNTHGDGFICHLYLWSLMSHIIIGNIKNHIITISKLLVSIILRDFENMRDSLCLSSNQLNQAKSVFFTFRRILHNDQSTTTCERIENSYQMTLRDFFLNTDLDGMQTEINVDLSQCLL